MVSILFPPLREKCPNTESFLVRISPHSDWTRIDTKYHFVFSPNAGKYGPEITPYLDSFHGVPNKQGHFWGKVSLLNSQLRNIWFYISEDFFVSFNGNILKICWPAWWEIIVFFSWISLTNVRNIGRDWNIFLFWGGS